MTEPLKVTVKAPESCTPAEVRAFEKLVVAGGEVDAHGLRARIEQAKALVFAHSSGQLVGTGAVKRPNANYRKSVFQKSRTTHLPAEFPWELGWIYVVPPQRGRGASRRIVEALLKGAKDLNVFATSRSDNTPMHRTLEHSGFVRAGTAYKSARGDLELQLFVRPAAKLRAGSAAPRPAAPRGPRCSQ